MSVDCSWAQRRLFCHLIFELSSFQRVQQVQISIFKICSFIFRKKLNEKAGRCRCRQNVQASAS